MFPKMIPTPKQFELSEEIRKHPCRIYTGVEDFQAIHRVSLTREPAHGPGQADPGPLHKT